MYSAPTVDPNNQLELPMTTVTNVGYVAVW